MAGEVVVEPATVAVPEAPVAPEAAEKPTREALAKEGWSEGEIASAEKRGMVAKAPPAPPVAAVAPPVAAAEPPVPSAPEPKPKTVIAGVDDVELTPEQEKVLLATFPAGQAGNAVRGLYFRGKNERRARQQSEERERKKDEEIAALRAQVAGKAPAEITDDEDQPITVRRLKELQEKEAKERERLQNEQSQRVSKVTEAAEAQEQYAKTVYLDFDDSLKLAADLVKNLDTLIPEKHRQGQVLRLWQDLNHAAANADQFDVQERHGAFIAYEIGRLHPNYGKPASASPAPKTASEKDPKGDGGPLSPEKMDRVVRNSQRAVSSAAVAGGGGKAIVAAEEMTAEQFNRLPASARMKVRDNHPEIYRRLIRGG